MANKKENFNIFVNGPANKQEIFVGGCSIACLASH
jgi:hypothetical protein